MITEQKIIVGSNPESNIVQTHPTVSREHLAITTEGDHILVEDLNSKNGTYINGRRIQKSVLTKKDNLKLGDYTVNVEDLFVRISQQLHKNRQDFYDEFASLRDPFDEYESRKKKIIDGPLMPFILRIGATLGIISVLLFYDSLIPDPGMRYSLILAVGALSMAMQRFGSTQAKKMERLEKLNLKYEDVLVCPKCRQSLMTKSLHYWETKGRCSGKNCDALFIRRP